MHQSKLMNRQTIGKLLTDINEKGIKMQKNYKTLVNFFRMHKHN